MSETIEKELSQMCNISHGIFDQGVQQGMQQGELKKEKELILNMYRNHIAVETIAACVQKPVEVVCTLLGLNSATETN